MRYVLWTWSALCLALLVYVRVAEGGEALGWALFIVIPTWLLGMGVLAIFVPFFVELPKAFVWSLRNASRDKK